MSGFQLAQVQAERYEATTSRFMDGSAALLAASAAIQPGDSVLDLACGTGLLARHAWRAATPGGRVVGTDINPAMLAVAERVGPQGIEWVEAPAHSQPFPDSSFDHVLCQQGLQFVPDAATAITECLRVLRPGGVLRATIWATGGRTPYIETQLELLAMLDARLFPSLRVAAPDDGAGVLAGWAREAGRADTTIDLIEHEVAIADLRTFVFEQTLSTPWGPTIEQLPDEQRREFVDGLVDELEPYRGADGVHRLPFAAFRLDITSL
ncbi:MAG TPA: methyltransferase domain-containing protein [Ilumatobacter sp.]